MTGAPGAGAGDRISRWEWVTAALGFVLVAGAITVLLVEGLAAPRRGPDVVLRADSIAAVAGGYRVHFRALNRGDQTAAALVVRAELSMPDGRVETSEAQLDYVPGRSERRGGFFFVQDPRRGALRMRAVGYAEP